MWHQCVHLLNGKMNTVYLLFLSTWQNQLDFLDRNLFLNNLHHLLELGTILYKLDMDNCIFHLFLDLSWWYSLCKRSEEKEVFLDPYIFQNKWSKSESQKFFCNSWCNWGHFSDLKKVFILGFFILWICFL